jgi:hypothetical protein
MSHCLDPGLVMGGVKVPIRPFSTVSHGQTEKVRVPIPEK